MTKAFQDRFIKMFVSSALAFASHFVFHKQGNIFKHNVHVFLHIFHSTRFTLCTLCYTKSKILYSNAIVFQVLIFMLENQTGPKTDWHILVLLIYWNISIENILHPSSQFIWIPWDSTQDINFTDSVLTVLSHSER